MIITIVSVIFVILFLYSCQKRERMFQAFTELVNERERMIAAGVDKDSTDMPIWNWWLNMMERDPKFILSIPIEFYGKVIDERDGTPIVGAKIWMQCSDTSRNMATEYIRYSDAAGKFSLTGVRGGGITVNPYKEGYYKVRKDIPDSFEYALFYESNFHRSDPNNPVIFKLRKAQGLAEGLLTREPLFKVIPNGEPTRIVLRTASKGTPADIEISMTRGERQANRRYDWSTTIAGVNGAGLIESNEEFMFEAPEEGYEEQYHYEFQANQAKYLMDIEKKYYVRSDDGKVHARIEVMYLSQYNDDAAVLMKFYINPTGSRNLESQPGVNLSNTLQPAKR